MTIMAEHNFERRVRQEMSDLKIDPSDAVWENVKIRIEKKKDKRRFFILFFLLGFLLLGGGYIIFYTPVTYKTSETTFNNHKEKSKNEQLTANNTGTSLSQKNTDKKDIPSSKKTDKTAPLKQLATLSAKSKNMSIDNTSTENPVKKTQHQKHQIHNKTQAGVISDIGLSSTNKIKEANRAKTNPVSTPSQVLIIQAPVNKNVDTNTIAVSTVNPEQHVDTGKTRIITSADISKDTASIASTNKWDSLTNFKTNDTLPSVAKVSKENKSASKHKWHIGLNLGGGISHVGNNVFSPEKAMIYDYVAPSSNNISNAVYRNIYNRVTPARVPALNSSGAYFISLFIERELSSVTAISAGINYTNFAVTYFKDNDYYALRSGFSGNVNKSYRSNFNFIEVPVEVKIRLAKIKNMPMYWQGGVSLSSLISSNALQYNPYASGNYYKDNSLFTKMQVGVNTALSIQLFRVKNNPVTIGPYFHYSLSALAKEGLYDKQHFIFTGLRTQILFKRK